jgi:hypothetical protein
MTTAWLKKGSVTHLVIAVTEQSSQTTQNEAFPFEEQQESHSSSG